MDVSLTKAARTDVVLKRHTKYPSDSDTDWKPLPDTVTGVLASDTAVEGHTDDTAADATYVNSTPLELNCCPFRETSTRRIIAADCIGVAHSSWLASTYRATTVLLLSKRHASVDDSRK